MRHQLCRAVGNGGDSLVAGSGLCHSPGGLSGHLLTFPSALSQAQEACGPLEIDSALGLVQSLERDLQEAKAAARDGKLKPLPGETVRVQGKVSQGGQWSCQRCNSPACLNSAPCRWRSVPRTWGTAPKLSALPSLTSWEKSPRAMRTTQVLASQQAWGKGH